MNHSFPELVVALDKASPNNWLDDNFWLEKAYLEWRAPLLVNSNWWLAFYEDDMIPKTGHKGETNNNRAGTTFWQLRRAAWLTWRILDFKDQMDRSVRMPSVRARDAEAHTVNLGKRFTLIQRAQVSQKPFDSDPSLTYFRHMVPSQHVPTL